MGQTFLVKKFLEHNKGKEKEVVVIPSVRETITKFGHVGCGQMGSKGVLSLLQCCFTYGHLEKKDIAQFCRSFAFAMVWE